MGRLHVEKLVDLSGEGVARVVGIYDIDRDKATEVAKSFGVPVVDSVEELAKRADAASVPDIRSCFLRIAPRYHRRRTHFNSRRSLPAHRNGIANRASMSAHADTEGKFQRSDPSGSTPSAVALSAR